MALEKTFEQENAEVYKGFLERFFFETWKKGWQKKYNANVERTLELYPTTACNTNCSYCYLNQFGDQTFYNRKAQAYPNALKNLDILLKYFEKRKLAPPTIEVFGGDIFSHEKLYPDYFQRLFEFNKRSWRKADVIVPTNSTFLFDSDKTKNVEKLLAESEKQGTRIGLSLSVDGKYSDNISRPMANGRIYTDEFYDRMFAFARNNHFSFHPMISKQAIHLWKKNFDWYLDEMMRFGIKPKDIGRHLYLLEVRNPDWTEKDLWHLSDFINHAIKKIFHKCFQGNKSDFIESLVFDTQFNFFSGLFSTNARGLSCSLQTALYVRGDLYLHVCHRLGYKNYEGGKFVVEDDEIVDIEAINHVFHMAAMGYNFRSGPYCNNCMIRSLCTGYCLGSNIETTGDPFVVPPTVCRLEHIKTSSIVKTLDELGIFENILSIMENSGGHATAHKLAALREVKKILKVNEV